MALDTQVYTFDPADVELIIGGIPIEHFGSDSMITLTPTNPRAEVQMGINGGTTVNRSRMLQGTIEVTVKAHSVSDQLFDQLGQFTNNAAVPLVLNVPSANKQLYTEAWYQEQAPLAVGSQIDDRTHVIGINNSSLSLIDSANSLIGSVERVFA